MILAHYYRAMVGRADVWRTRMDTTTNWTMGATAAIVSFTLGNPAIPHYAVSIAVLMTLGFLVLEARRLTFYHLWQQRVLLLERELIRPALHAVHTDQNVSPSPEETGPDSTERAGREEADLIASLDAGLGRTVPSMSHHKAIARRLRRIYLYIFGVQLLAWILKLSNHPSAVTSPVELVTRAQIGAVPGVVVLVSTAALFLAAVILGFGYGGVDRDPA
jgi:uncharacterized membrane protein